jgi:hypothetical protein
MPASPIFRHLKKGYTLHVHTANVGGGKRDTHAVHFQTQRLMVLFLLYDIEKSNPNAGMSGIGISSGSQLPQSGIDIPASGFSAVPMVTDYSGIAQLCKFPIYYLPLSDSWPETSLSKRKRHCQ